MKSLSLESEKHQQPRTLLNHWELGAHLQFHRILYIRLAPLVAAPLKAFPEELVDDLSRLGSSYDPAKRQWIPGRFFPAQWTPFLPQPSSPSSSLSLKVSPQDRAALQDVLHTIMAQDAGDAEICLTTSSETSRDAFVAAVALIKSFLNEGTGVLPVVTLAAGATASEDTTTKSGQVLFLSPLGELHPEIQALKVPRTDAPSPKLSPLDLDAVVQELKSKLPGFSLPDLGLLGRKSAELARVIAHLRAPGGCPWDREQTFASLRPYLIEEAYEATEAADHLVESRDPEGFVDELGDVLLQIVLNAQLGAEEGLFDLVDVIAGLTAKMIRRHPHVFEPAASGPATSAAASSGAMSAEDVKVLWEKVKTTEGSNSPSPQGQGSPEATGTNKIPESAHLLKKAAKKKSLPTLEYATAISKRAAKLGFCWRTLPDVWRDVESEIQELRHELLADRPDFSRIEDELGDVVYALANVVTHCSLHFEVPQGFGFDDAVRKALRKFLNRFAEMELLYAESQGHPLTESRAQDLNLDAWNDLWKAAKKRRYR